MFLLLDINTEIAQAVGAMMARANKENLHFDDNLVKRLFPFVSQCFLKEIENMFSVFLLSYRNTHESLGELEKAVSGNTRLRFVFLQHYSFSQTSTLLSITSQKTCYMFSIS